MSSKPHFRSRLRRTALLPLVIAAAAAACVRGASVQPAPTPVYAVSVRNTTAAEIVVSYDDGAASRALGTVPAGRTERFVIAAPASTTVDIVARAASGNATFQPVTVQLVAGSTIPVTIR